MKDMTGRKYKIACAVLAGGLSVRMGSPKEKIIIEPNEDFVRVVKNVAPRKVFTD